MHFYVKEKKGRNLDRNWNVLAGKGTVSSVGIVLGKLKKYRASGWENSRFAGDKDGFPEEFSPRKCRDFPGQ